MSLRTCPPHGCGGRLPWGLAPNRGINRGDPLPSEDPDPALRSALGVSHTLDGLLSPRPRGLVSSRNHVRDSPFRGLFPPPSRAVSSTVRALVSLTISACLGVAAVAPARMTSPSGPWSGWRSATVARVFSSCGVRSPHRLRSSGSSLCTWGRPSPSLRSWPSLPGPACDPGRQPPAYRSMPSSILYP